MTVSQTAKRVCNVLGTKGRWTQGVPARDAEGTSVQPTSPKAVCWCIAGATQCVTTYAERVMFYDAFHMVHHQSVSRFNDTHTYSEVIAALEVLVSDEW